MSLRDAVHRVEEGLIALILGAMTLLSFVQVVLRYVFNSGLIWQLEATTYLFAWLVMIGISYCVRVHAHIGVDAAVRLLPPNARRVVGIVVLLLALLYASLMFYGSIEYIKRMMIIDVEAEDIPIETWVLSICLPIGFGLLMSGCSRWAGASPPDVRKAMSSPTRWKRRSRTSPTTTGPTPRRRSDEHRLLVRLHAGSCWRSACRSRWRSACLRC